MQATGQEIGALKALIEAGGSTALIAALMYALKTLWGLVISKDGQLMEERDKREELIKESILASRSMFESTEKIVQALERIERKVVSDDEHN
jgi:hypothetical protein